MKGDLFCNKKKKLLTLPFCDELCVILEIYCEEMFIYIRPVDGEDILLQMLYSLIGTNMNW